MQQAFTLLFALCCTLAVSAQSLIVGFENFGIPVDSFLEEAPGGSFEVPPLVFPNSFEGGFYSEWAISSKTDTETRGFTNQYSAITGQGADNSFTYAVGYKPFGQPLIIRRQSDGTSVERQFRNLFVTNTTYAYYSMLEGDDFAKAFGGETGDDPDFFSIVIRAYDEGALLPDSVEFFLADYRFADNSLDYIVSEWTQVNLSNTFDRPVDSLQIDFRGSDTGDFGINTPLYVAIDNVRLEPFTATTGPTLLASPAVYPNPVAGHLTVANTDPRSPVQLLDIYGRVLRHENPRTSQHRLDLTDLPAGVYWLRVPGHRAAKIVKE